MGCRFLEEGDYSQALDGLVMGAQRMTYDMSVLNRLGSKITADGDCSHEIQRRLLLGRKGMTILLLLLSRFSRV